MTGIPRPTARPRTPHAQPTLDHQQLVPAERGQLPAPLRAPAPRARQFMCKPHAPPRCSSSYSTRAAHPRPAATCPRRTRPATGPPSRPRPSPPPRAPDFTLGLCPVPLRALGFPSVISQRYRYRPCNHTCTQEVSLQLDVARPFQSLLCFRNPRFKQ